MNVTIKIKMRSFTASNNDDDYDNDKHIYIAHFSTRERTNAL